jgi:hypothetical protein
MTTHTTTLATDGTVDDRRRRPTDVDDDRI